MRTVGLFQAGRAIEVAAANLLGQHPAAGASGQLEGNTLDRFLLDQVRLDLAERSEGGVAGLVCTVNVAAGLKGRHLIAAVRHHAAPLEHGE